MVVHSPEQGRSEKDSTGSNPVYNANKKSTIERAKADLRGILEIISHG